MPQQAPESYVLDQPLGAREDRAGEDLGRLVAYRAGRELEPDVVADTAGGRRQTPA